MKKALYLLMSAVMTVSAAGASAGQGGKRILTVYFSHSGNTEAVARMIHEAAGGDVFRIETVDEYPTEYRAVVDKAKREVESGYRPAIRGRVENFDDYDVIFVGSPCWWYTMAPAVATFLTSYDFAGKTIVPFMTHEGSRFAHTLDDIRKLCPEARLLEGFTVRGGKAADAGDDVREWIGGLGLGK